MKTLAHHLEHVRGRPPHIRKQVAFALALGATALIALIWLAVELATGSFQIQDTSFADAATSENAPTSALTAHSSLLGAALAAFSATTSPAQLQVVNANAGAPAAPAHSDTRTVIPF